MDMIQRILNHIKPTKVEEHFKPTKDEEHHVTCTCDAKKSHIKCGYCIYLIIDDVCRAKSESKSYGPSVC